MLPEPALTGSLSDLIEDVLEFVINLLQVDMAKSKDLSGG
jgi:hypothetical protein